MKIILLQKILTFTLIKISITVALNPCVAYNLERVKSLGLKKDSSIKEHHKYCPHYAKNGYVKNKLITDTNIRYLEKKISIRKRNATMFTENHSKFDSPSSHKVTVGTHFHKSCLRLIVSGAPASGKGTQCNIIKNKYGVVHLSTGDMLRCSVETGSEVGKHVKHCIDSGKLVSDSVISHLVTNRLVEENCQKNGWLLDGFPRTLAQADALFLADAHPDYFLFLKVPDEKIIERIVGRRIDPMTGNIYHITFSPPENKYIKKRLVQRSDDKIDKVKTRLEEFHANIEALKCIYSHIYIEIDGDKSPEIVASNIDEAISSKV